MVTTWARVQGALGEKVVGVLDIDSPLLHRFTEADRVGLEAFARILEKAL